MNNRKPRNGKAEKKASTFGSAPFLHYLCMDMTKRQLLMVAALLWTAATSVCAQTQPKREFRGAWIQCVNNQWNGMGRDRMQTELTRQLNELQRSGINTVLFQVRAEGDALYPSPYEPWSRFLTGQQGTAPNPWWDPLQWMVDECHRRGMELHAWINPFRAKTKGTPALTSLYYRQHPDRFFEYDGLWLFDPGVPENRNYICHIAADIVRRYDVDGLHIDDYFYPYPAAGVQIPDDATYRRYGGSLSRGDWRRDNVNRFMRQLSDSVHGAKPWVKFGVSPFGIYRNQSSSAGGSRTNGLQNYDDLYADVLLWVNQGWVDYNIPQLYWQIGHPTADYEELLRWWNANAGNRPLIIGQDIERTVKYADTRNNGLATQTQQKYDLQRRMNNVQGSCQWYAKACVDNVGGYTDILRQRYHRFPALQPLMPWLDDKAPKRVGKLRVLWDVDDAPVLMWSAPKANSVMQEARNYVVYAFPDGEEQDLDNVSRIVAVTPQTFVKLNYSGGDRKWTFVVTATDRTGNESRSRSKSVKL